MRDDLLLFKADRDQVARLPGQVVAQLLIDQGARRIGRAQVVVDAVHGAGIAVAAVVDVGLGVFFPADLQQL